MSTATKRLITTTINDIDSGTSVFFVPTAKITDNDITPLEDENIRKDGNSPQTTKKKRHAPQTIIPIAIGRDAGQVDSNNKKTRVVAIARRKGIITQSCDIYIGRECKMGGWNLAQSVWHNPFSVKSCGGSVTKAVAQFEIYLRSKPSLMARLNELKGKELGCWCKKPSTPNAPCHGDVLARLADAT